jgi:hypothetical protein
MGGGGAGEVYLYFVLLPLLTKSFFRGWRREVKVGCEMDCGRGNCNLYICISQSGSMGARNVKFLILVQLFKQYFHLHIIQVKVKVTLEKGYKVPERGLEL